MNAKQTTLDAYLTRTATIRAKLERVATGQMEKREDSGRRRARNRACWRKGRHRIHIATRASTGASADNKKPARGWLLECGGAGKTLDAP